MVIQKINESNYVNEPPIDVFAKPVQDDAPPAQKNQSSLVSDFKKFKDKTDHL